MFSDEDCAVKNTMLVKKTMLVRKTMHVWFELEKTV